MMSLFFWSRPFFELGANTFHRYNDELIIKVASEPILRSATMSRYTPPLRNVARTPAPFPFFHPWSGERRDWRGGVRATGARKDDQPARHQGLQRHGACARSSRGARRQKAVP